MEFRKLITILLCTSFPIFLALITLRYIVQPSNPHIKNNNFDILFWILFGFAFFISCIYLFLNFYFLLSEKNTDSNPIKQQVKYKINSFFLLAFFILLIFLCILDYFFGKNLIYFILSFVLGLILVILAIYLDFRNVILGVLINKNVK